VQAVKKNAGIVHQAPQLNCPIPENDSRIRIHLYNNNNYQCRLRLCGHIHQ